MAIIPGSNSSETLTGTNGDDIITGLAGIDRLYGLAGTDSLDGGLDGDYLDGGPGDDIMLGGAGSDIYYADSAGDQITELANEGTDAVSSSVSISLADNVEHLYLTGTADINGTGNALRNTIRDNAGINILSGGDGDNSYVVQNSADQVIEQANEGTDYVSSSVSFTLGTNVENLVLKGNADIDGTGNGLNNRLTGNAGLNVLTGSAGNDHYYVQNTGDQVVEQQNGGTDFVHSSVDFTLPDNVEHLYLTGTADINGTGNALRNVITGDAGINVLAGGAGNDSYVVQNAGDQAVEQANEGTDYVSSTVSYTIGDNVENLVLRGSAAIDGTGNALRNRLTGNSGLNVLTGGASNDIYDVQNTGDQVVEQASQGNDIVYSSVTFSLSANVEMLVLTTTGDINGTGNGLANIITGNAGDNVLDGGAGNDKLRGGAGNDTFIVDSFSEVVTDSSGVDLVKSSVSHSLSAGLENLTLLGDQPSIGVGNAADNVMTGHVGENSLHGGEGADTLNGGAGDDFLNGGLGADTMAGGSGNDEYLVDDQDDQVIEDAGAGVDEIRTSVSVTLPDNVENGLIFFVANQTIRITGNELNNRLESGHFGELAGGEGNDTYVVGLGTVIEQPGEGTDTVILDQQTFFHDLEANVENLVLIHHSDGYGNDLDNKITGAAGINEIGGGRGNDTLTGGEGEDTFQFDTALNASNNVDRITDLNVGDDIIELENAVFTGLATGVLAAGAFHIGAAAADDDDRIIYNDVTRALIFDADGSGAGAAIRFATLTTGPAPTNVDFVVV